MFYLNVTVNVKYDFDDDVNVDDKICHNPILGYFSKSKQNKPKIK